METDATETLAAAVAFYSDPATAHEAFVALRWSNSVVYCPRCTSFKVTLFASRLTWKCRACRRKFTAKVGTPLEDSAIPLTKWLPVYWAVVNLGTRVNSSELSRRLSVTQKTAWLMIQRVRRIVESGTFERTEE